MAGDEKVSTVGKPIDGKRKKRPRRQNAMLPLEQEGFDGKEYVICIWSRNVEAASQKIRWEVKRKARITRFLKRLMARGLEGSQGRTKSNLTYSELVNKVVHIRDHKKLEIDFPKRSAPSVIRCQLLNNPTSDLNDVKSVDKNDGKGGEKHSDTKNDKCTGNKLVYAGERKGNAVANNFGKKKKTCNSCGEEVCSSAIEMKFIQEQDNEEHFQKPWKQKITQLTRKQLFAPFFRRMFVALSCFRGNKDFVVV